MDHRNYLGFLLPSLSLILGVDPPRSTVLPGPIPPSGISPISTSHRDASDLRPPLSTDTVLVESPRQLWPSTARIEVQGDFVEGEILALPITFHVATGNRFYLRGIATDSIAIASDAPDQLLLNGKPLTRYDKRVDSGWRPVGEERLLEIYGGVPMFDSLVEAGMRPGEASRRYYRACTTLTAVGSRARSKLIRQGHDVLEASQYGMQAMRSADTLRLMEWDSCGARAHSWTLRYRGQRYNEVLMWSAGPGAREEGWAEYRMRLFATHLNFYLTESPRPYWLFLSDDYCEAAYGEEAVRDVEKQLDRARRTGRYSDYPLSEEIVREVLGGEIQHE